MGLFDKLFCSRDPKDQGMGPGGVLPRPFRGDMCVPKPGEKESSVIPKGPFRSKLDGKDDGSWEPGKNINQERDGRSKKDEDRFKGLGVRDKLKEFFGRDKKDSSKKSFFSKPDSNKPKQRKRGATESLGWCSWCGKELPPYCKWKYALCPECDGDDKPDASKPKSKKGCEYTRGFSSAGSSGEDYSLFSSMLKKGYNELYYEAPYNWGVVNIAENKVFTYSEGDTLLAECKTKANLLKEAQSHITYFMNQGYSSSMYGEWQGIKEKLIGKKK